MKTHVRHWQVLLGLTILTVVVVAAFAFQKMFIAAPTWVSSAGKRADPRAEPLAHQADAKAREVERRFNESVVMLHAKQYEHALTALHRVLELAPAMPEAHVNMGYTMLGLMRHAAARDFFNGAIELRPTQANAYYGLAMAHDGLNDRPMALGAMRTFVHLARPDDPYLRKARAALWEWQPVPLAVDPAGKQSTPQLAKVAPVTSGK